MKLTEVTLLSSHGPVVLFLAADVLNHVLRPVDLPVVCVVFSTQFVAFLQQPLVLFEHYIDVAFLNVPYLLARYLHQVQLLGHPLAVLQQLLVLVAGILLLHTGNLTDVLVV